MASFNDLDLTKIPISALRKPTVTCLSNGLNSVKVLPNSDGLPRDWRGLAHLFGLNNSESVQLRGMPDPTLSLLSHWAAKQNVSSLQEFLGAIDRFDVLDDVKYMLEKDCCDYVKQLSNVTESISNNNIQLDGDRIILTIDDVARIEKGLEPQVYDAYVLYAEEDVEFATEIIQTMENKYNFKFCVRDRDLIGGVQFEHDAITKLIAERCRRLVVIVSPNFLKSKANKFFVTFAQALGIDIRERKVIPILYERCAIPPELSYTFLLDYNRAGKLWNFWDKLRDSIQASETGTSSVGSARRSDANVAGDEIWTSVKRFEEKPDESTSSLNDSSETKNRNSSATPNVYKFIKNTFVKSKKISNGEMAGSDEVVSYEDLENSSSFESKDESPRTSKKSKKVKKMKWFKKKNVEPLLS